jgi:hypothetical protein
MMYDKFKFESLKMLMQSVCQLSHEEITELEGLCFQYATTTVLPNGDVTYLLMERCYKLLIMKLANKEQIVDNFQYWMMMPL